MEYFFKLTGQPPLELGKAIVKNFNMAVDPHVLYHAKEILVKEKLKNIEIIHPVAEIAKQYHGKLPLAVGTGSHRKLALQLLDRITSYNVCYTKLLRYLLNLRREHYFRPTKK